MKSVDPFDIQLDMPAREVRHGLPYQWSTARVDLSALRRPDAHAAIPEA
jgi:hypothetical protein